MRLKKSAQVGVEIGGQFVELIAQQIMHEWFLENEQKEAPETITTAIETNELYGLENLTDKKCD